MKQDFNDDLEYIDINCDDREEKPKKKMLVRVCSALIIVGIILLFVGITRTIIILNKYKHDKSLYSDASSIYLDVNFTNYQIVENADNDTAANEYMWYDMVDVLFDNLKSINKEVVSWIYFEDGTISYPVVKADDNEKYLGIAYDGTKAMSGSIFLDCRNADISNEFFTIIYGHNMKNQTMFGSLKRYRESTYDNGFFQIINETGKYRYKIFASKDILEDDELYSFDSITKEQLFADIKKLRNSSYIYSDCYVSSDSHIVMLSTCSESGKRLAVFGVMVDSH